MMKIDVTELSYWLALLRADGVGNIQMKEIIQKYHSAENYFLAHPQIKQKIEWKEIDDDLKWAESPDCHLITFQDENYPLRLKEIHASPPLLFVEGDAGILSQFQIGMVGSRNPTMTGSDTAYQFAQAFAANGLVVTSGLAVGIDGASHQGALDGKGKTIAVMGTGPDKIYPASHRALSKKIAENGCLVTEFPTGVTPAAKNFPRRNRIISGLSLGVVVVEAAFASGSLVTAKYALEQNREIFAIPGSIQNPLARGCHALIKQGAKLVETAQDVLEEINGNFSSCVFEKFKAPKKVKKKEFQQNSSAVKIAQIDPFLDCIGFETTSIDIIIQRSALTAEKVSSMLLLLELEGQIASVPGGYVRLV